MTRDRMDMIKNKIKKSATLKTIPHTVGAKISPKVKLPEKVMFLSNFCTTNLSMLFSIKLVAESASLVDENVPGIKPSKRSFRKVKMESYNDEPTKFSANAFAR